MTLKRISRLLLIMLVSLCLILGAVSLILLATGDYSLGSLGRITNWIGLIIAVLGIMVAPFWHSEIEIHSHHQGTISEKRQKNRSEMAHFNNGIIIFAFGVLVFFIGWGIMNLFYCERIFCK